MLYEVTFTPDDVNGRNRHEVVESPKASRFGIVRDELISWATDTWGAQFNEPGEITIAAYIPTRVGYKSSNAYGVNSIAHTWTLYEIPIGSAPVEPEPEPEQDASGPACTDDADDEYNVGDPRHCESCKHALCGNYVTACAECIADELEAIDDQMLRYAM